MRHRVQLVDDQAALWLVAELQGNGLSGLDLRCLRGVIQQVALLGDGLLSHQSRTRVDTLNQDGSCGIGSKVAIAIAYYGTIALSDKELHVGQGFTGRSVNLFDQ